MPNVATAPRERIIVAMDVSDLDLAREIAADIAGCVGPTKIGREAMSAGIGHQLADIVIESGGIVLWDGKEKDIPNTVGKAVLGLLQRLPSGIWAFNVHADGGIPMMKAAVDNRGDSSVLAVTLLTSLDEEDAQAIYGVSVKAVVLQRAREAKRAGVQGIICSAREVRMLRSHPELEDLFFVTPAIRPEWSVAADQKRPTTPKDAILSGADFIVVGRPITNPPGGRTRREAAELVAKEVEEALAEREGQGV